MIYNYVCQRWDLTPSLRDFCIFTDCWLQHADACSADCCRLFSCTVFDDLSHRLSTILWSLPLYCRGWIKIMLVWPVFLFNQFEAQLIIGLRRSQQITGGHCLPSSSQHSTSVLVQSAALSLICQQDVDFSHQLPDFNLVVHPSWLVTVGDHSFSTAGPQLWNSLLEYVQSALSLITFRQKLKFDIFVQSYSTIILQLYRNIEPWSYHK